MKASFAITPRTLTSTIKLYYKSQENFLGLPLDPRFIGNKQDLYIMPRLYSANTQELMTKEDSESLADTPRKDAHHKPISLIHLFEKNSDKNYVLISSSNSLDDSLLSQNLIFKWANNKLWNEFKYVFRLDLSSMNKDSLKDTKSFEDTNSILIKLIQHSPCGADVTDYKIINIFDKNPSEVLFIIDGYDVSSTYKTLFDSAIRTAISKYNVILVANEELEEHIAKPDLSLKSELLTYSESKAYLHSSLNEDKYNQVLDFFDRNKNIKEILNSPGLLQMTAYILSDAKEINKTEIYAKLYSMLKDLKIEKEIIKTHDSINLFKIAQDLKEQLMDYDKVLKTLNYISSISDDSESSLILEFLAGLISLHENTAEKNKLMNIFLESVISSGNDLIKIGGDNAIFMLMKLASQTTHNGKIDSSFRKDLIEYIDQVILTDLSKWQYKIIESGYSSERLVQHLVAIRPENKQEYFTASKIIPALKITKEYRDSVAIKFIEDTHNQDLRIVRSSINALAHMGPNSKQTLFASLEDSIIHIKLVAIEAISHFDDASSVDKIFQQLKSEDHWVKIASIDALKRMYRLANQDVKDQITNGLLLSLGEIDQGDKATFEGKLKLLGKLNYNIGKIKDHFLFMFKNFKDDNELDLAIRVLKNISFNISIEAKEEIAQLFIDKLYHLKSHLPGFLSIDRHYPSRAELREALSELFSNIKEDNKKKFYDLLKAGINHNKSELISASSIKALGKIFDYNQEEIGSLLINNISELSIDSLKVINIQEVKKLFNFLSPPQKVIAINKITQIISSSSNIDTLTASLNFLSQINIATESPKFKDLPGAILKIIQANANNSLTIAAIESLGNVFKVPHNEIFQKLKFTFYNPRSNEEKEAIIKLFIKIHSELSLEQKTEVISLLKATAEKDAFEELRIMAKEAMNILDISYDAKAENTPLSYIELYEKAYSLNSIATISEFINKYSRSTADLEMEDQIKLDSLVDAILLKALNADNKFAIERLGSLLYKAKDLDNKVQKFLKLYDIPDQAAAFKKLSSIFGRDFGFKASLISQDKPSVKALFPTIEDLIKKIDKFAEYVKDNNLDIIISRDAISIAGEEYISLQDLGRNRILYMEYAKQIFNALKINSSNKLVKFVDNSTSQDLLSGLDQMEVEGEKIKLSILHQVNENGEIINVFSFIEERTIFGDVLIQKIKSSRSDSKLSIHSNLDSNYRTDIFGNPSEHIAYYLLSFYVSKEDVKQLLHVIKDPHPQGELMAIVKKIIEDNKVEVSRDQKFKGAIKVSQNDLLQHERLEKRLEIVEHKVSDIELEIKSHLKELDIKTEDLEVKIKSFIKEFKDAEVLPDLNPYQQFLYNELIQGLNALHMAAMVVQTPMVQNSKKGIVGSMGVALDWTSKYVPMVGPVVGLFGVILQAVDIQEQARISKNIANIAIDSTEMSILAKALAKKMVMGNIKEAELIKNIFKDSIVNNLSAVSIRSEVHIVHKVIEVISEFFENCPTDDAGKASRDAKAIISGIIGYLSIGEFKLASDYKTILGDFLEDRFLEHHHELHRVASLEQITPPEVLTLSSSSSYGEIEDDKAPSMPIDALSSKRQSLFVEEDSPTILATFSNSYENLESYKTPKILLDSLSDDVSDIESQKEPQKLITLEPISQEALDMGLAGGALMNGIEVIPSFKYLLNQIPGMNYIANLEAIKAISPYQHYIYTGLHAIGNAAYTYYNALDPVSAIASTATYSLKPQAYIFRDNLLQYLDQNNDGLVKYVTHITTDSALSAVIALPIAISNPIAFSYFIAQGAVTGSINYYNSEIREDNIVGQGLAIAATTNGLYQCYLMVDQQPDMLTKIIAIEGCIPALAAIHLNTKFAGDAAYDVGNNIYSYLAGNETNLEI